MQTSRHATLGRIDMVLLHKIRAYSFRRQDFAAESLGKESSVIDALVWYDHEDAFYIKSFDLHCSTHGTLIESLELLP